MTSANKDTIYEESDIDVSVQDIYRPVLLDMDINLFNFTKEEYEQENEEDLEKISWWTEQLRRIKYGYMAPDGVWLNPFYYFFLNFCKADIFNFETEDSVISNPFYFKFQHELADIIWFCKYEVRDLEAKLKGTTSERQRRRLIKNAQNIILAKARRKGLTTLVCAYLIWLFLFADGVFGSYKRMGYGYPDDDTYNKFRAMFDIMLTSLPEMLRPNLTTPDNETEIGNSYKDKVTGEIKTTNIIYWANFGKKDGKFRGGKLFFVFFDEAGKFTNWKKVRGSSKDCFSIGERVIGYYLLGGTSDAISNKGYQDYKDDFDNPHLTNSISHFITAEEGAHPFIDYKTGLSLREDAHKFYINRRTALVAGGDIVALNTEKQENPIIKEELFMPGGGSTYDQDEINEQIIWIGQTDKQKKDILIGELEFEKDYLGRDTRKVVFVEKPNGNWAIYRNGFPVENKPNLFFGAIDDVYQNIAPSSDSLPAMMIYKDWDITEEESDLPVAIYLNKEKNRRKRHEDFLKGSIFWNAKVLFENNDEAYVNYCKGKGEMQFLQKTTNEKIGYSGHAWHGKFKNQAEELMLKSIDNKRHKRIYFIKVLQGLKDWGIKNTDIGICHHACMLYQQMRNTLSEIEKLEKPEHQHAIVVSRSNARPQNIPVNFSRFKR